MKIMSAYSVKIKNYNKIFNQTAKIYRAAVDFYIGVILDEWNAFSEIKKQTDAVNLAEKYTVVTANRPTVKYDFGKKFYKFPSYMRRAVIADAYGKVCSYKSNLDNWVSSDPKNRGREPSLPKAGFAYPAMYRDNCYERTGNYTARIKVYIRNTWDWLDIELKKSDADYIIKHCSDRKECVPTLQKRGKEWFLDFPFEEKVTLDDTNIFNQTILAVDLGINNAATVSVMRSDGAVLGRHFCKLPKEYDSLNHAINRIKKAQQHGNHKTPRLWAKADGINNRIAVLTAQFIIDIAALYNVDAIVFEHLDRNGRKRGSKKQMLHLWRSQYVQAMVTDKAHRLGMHISHICAWGTSKLAWDGSGNVLRGEKAELKSYSLCKFSNGKVYNCDLNASYNIGSRYFIREILKSLPERERLVLEAKVPQVTKRSTCTFSTLINLNAAVKSA